MLSSPYDQLRQHASKRGFNPLNGVHKIHTLSIMIIKNYYKT